MTSVAWRSLPHRYNPPRADTLRRVGVDHPIVDDGNVAAQVRSIFPGGVGTALELVGTPTLPDTLRATRVHGVVCFTGMLSNQWIDQRLPEHPEAPVQSASLGPIAQPG